MATATVAPELDEYGNPKKRATALPQQDPVATQPQPVALSDAALAGAATPESVAQGNLDLIGTAQRSVAGRSGDPTELQTATGAQALRYVNDPMGGYDPVAAKRSALEKGSTDWANSFEGLRQQFGNVSGSGLLQENMLENALQHNVDQQTLGADMDKRNYDIYSDAMVKSLASANSTTANDASVYSSYLNNLGTVNTMGERAIADQLAQRGFDYQVLKDAVAAGTATQADLDAFLAKVGISVSPNARQTVMTEETQNRQYQYGLQHPNSGYTNPDGTLNERGLAAWASAEGEAAGEGAAATYQNLIAGKADRSQFRGGADAGSENNAAFSAVAAKASEYTGFTGNSPPPLSSVVKRGNNVYYVLDTSKRTDKRTGMGDYVLAEDLNTGAQVKLYSDGMIG
jgi:hypothetical protein